jgi:hypothetical protein
MAGKLELAFVTFGALLGIEFVGRNTEHIVALAADPVNERSAGSRVRCGRHGLLRDGRRSGVGHGGILPREGGEAGSCDFGGEAGV